MSDIALKFIEEVIGAFTQPESRFFLPWLASAVLFAWGAIFLQTRGKGTGEALREAIGPKVLFHRSALADYQLIFVNMLLDVLGAGVVLVGVAAIAHVGASVLASVFGPSPHWSAGFAMAAAFTLATVTANDFANFSFHERVGFPFVSSPVISVNGQSGMFRIEPVLPGSAPIGRRNIALARPSAENMLI